MLVQFFPRVHARYSSLRLLGPRLDAFIGWTTIFPGAACATALVDRVVHHAEVIHLEGKSYRLRESQLAEETKPKKPARKRRATKA